MGLDQNLLPTDVLFASQKSGFGCLVKLVHNDHPQVPKKVAVVDRWSMFRSNKVINSKWDYKMRDIQNGGRYKQVVAIRR